MPLMQWSDRLSVGLTSIDAQHKRFVDLINDLHDAMTSGKGGTVVGSTLKDLAAYTRVHFASEEGLMRRHGYPDYAPHKAIHDALVARVEDLRRRQDAGETAVTVDVLTMLTGWLTDHIQGVDKRYSPFMQSKGVN